MTLHFNNSYAQEAYAHAHAVLPDTATEFEILSKAREIIQQNGQNGAGNIFRSVERTGQAATARHTGGIDTFFAFLRVMVSAADIIVSTVDTGGSVLALAEISEKIRYYEEKR